VSALHVRSAQQPRTQTCRCHHPHPHPQPHRCSMVLVLMTQHGQPYGTMKLNADWTSTFMPHSYSYSLSFRPPQNLTHILTFSVSLQRQSAVLGCTVLYCTVLFWTVLYCILAMHSLCHCHCHHRCHVHRMTAAIRIRGLPTASQSESGEES